MKALTIDEAFVTSLLDGLHVAIEATVEANCIEQFGFYPEGGIINWKYIDKRIEDFIERIEANGWEE